MAARRALLGGPARAVRGVQVSACCLWPANCRLPCADCRIADCRVRLHPPYRLCACRLGHRDRRGLARGATCHSQAVLDVNERIIDACVADGKTSLNSLHRLSLQWTCASFTVTPRPAAWPSAPWQPRLSLARCTLRARRRVALPSCPRSHGGVDTHRPSGLTFSRYEHLVSMGLLNRNDRQSYARCQRYYPHAIGHWLGLDVHDTPAVTSSTVRRASRSPRPRTADAPLLHSAAPASRSQVLEPGMVVTVEPGLYFPVDDPQLPDWCKGIGIRIEDDVLVCADGAPPEVLTARAPKRPDEVEALMQGGNQSAL